MTLAIEKAKQGFGMVSPNPLVGAVVVIGDKLISTGAHLKFGGPHAEVNALSATDIDLNGADIYVTLEPCSHFGKTPPCAKLLIKRGLKRVFIAMEDPNKLVAGRGIKMLREAGIEVSVGLCHKEALELNQPFIKNMISGESYLFLKSATTIDGKIATANGSSKWITNPIARERVDYYRAKYCAVLCGANTLREDNPGLTIRSDKFRGADEPFRIFICTRLGTVKSDLQVINKAVDGKTLIFTTEKNRNSDDTKRLSQLGVKFAFFNGERVTMGEVLKETASRGIDSVLLEGGSSLISMAIKENLVDAGELFIAPKILGDESAISVVTGFSPSTIKDGFNLQNVKPYIYGDNISFRFQNHRYGY